MTHGNLKVDIQNYQCYNLGMIQKSLFVLVVLALLFTPFSLYAAEGESGDKINFDKTTENLFILSAMTLLPIIQLGVLQANPEFKNELTVSIAISAIPALIGWPSFLREYSNYKKRVRAQNLSGNGHPNK